MKKIGLVLIVYALMNCCKEIPAIKLTNPIDGAIVGGIIDITVEITDDSDILSVGFYINDSLKYFTQSKPYSYKWNTLLLDDSSTHNIYIKASLYNGDYVYSDTISVTIFNPLLVNDDFEYYHVGEYPDRGGWFEIWFGAGETYVDTGCAHHGFKSFKLNGTSSWPRTDGIKINLTKVHTLTYECALYIPNSSQTGSIFGFYVQINPSLGTIYNGILFDFQDNQVYVRGTIPVSTGYVWNYNIWYSVKVTLNYDNLTMDVWVNNQKIAEKITAASPDQSNIFALATQYGANGVVFYDDVKIFK